MEYKYILSSFCKDRPGIVAAITKELYELGCNLKVGCLRWERN